MQNNLAQLAIIYHHYFLQNQLVHHIDINPYMANVLISKAGHCMDRSMQNW